jgi:hypothetical protein
MELRLKTSQFQLPVALLLSLGIAISFAVWHATLATPEFSPVFSTEDSATVDAKREKALTDSQALVRSELERVRESQLKLMEEQQQILSSVLTLQAQYAALATLFSETGLEAGAPVEPNIEANVENGPPIPETGRDGNLAEQLDAVIWRHPPDDNRQRIIEDEVFAALDDDRYRDISLLEVACAATTCRLSFEDRGDADSGILLEALHITSPFAEEFVYIADSTDRGDDTTVVYLSETEDAFKNLLADCCDTGDAH